MADTAQASAAEDTADSREIRVFLSSTFRDFNEERKLLATQVFPELNRRARERGVELVEVDLRWGVTQEQAEDGHALEICLAEIERCRRYFIGMLGDSYGSLTPPERQLLQAAPELLEQRQWLNGKIGQASYTELEIEQRLQQMGGNASDGRAFFYFRDQAWSNPKADAGEPGWRSDDPADRQKLELLRNRIRSSGYPLVEGLRDPQAIADQIKDDLWALIDRQFPEGEQPDALQKEARKHADYRRSRTGAGQYIGGEGYIEQLERWITDGQQQILITGESGAGKSALLANWIERHSQRHPDDDLYAHHLGCTNDANALRPLLGRLIDTASQQLQEAGVISEALAVPEDWWELVAKVAETLQTLGHWCQQQGRRWIWVLDGLDRLDPDDQKALPWLPPTLPDGVQVVASALAGPAREILLERGYTTLTIQPLEEKEQEQLIQRYLKRYTKELDGGLRQQILSHHLAGSPLFLKVLLEELRQCGRHDTLKEQLDFYLSSQTVDDLYERVLERLENDGSGDAVRKVMTALWASRAGLTESELLAITDLKPLQWAPIDLALEKAFGRNGNRLVFDHDYLRIAVQDRYLPTEGQQRQAHSVLADWIEAQDDWDERVSEEFPWQLQQAGLLEDLRDWLLTPWALANLQWDRGSREVINYWLAVKDEADGELDELIAEAVEEEIKERKEDAADQIWFVDRIAALLDEAGLYRELLLRLRTLSLELEEASEDRGCALILTSIFWLARTHRDLGNYEEALRHFNRCLDVLKQNEAADSALALDCMDKIASTYQDLGELSKAKHLFEECITKSKSIMEDRHPAIATTTHNLGLLCGLMNRPDEAEKHLAEAFESRCNLFGLDHPYTLTTAGALGVLYSETASTDKASYFLDIAYSGLLRHYGPRHPDTLTALNNLAALNQDNAKYDLAEKQYAAALEGQTAVLGFNHPDTLLTRYNQAQLFLSLGRLADSEGLLLELTSDYQDRLGAKHPDTISAFDLLEKVRRKLACKSNSP